MIAAKHFFAYLPSGEPDPAETARLRAAFEALGYRTTEQPCLLGCIPFDIGTASIPPETGILQVTRGTEIQTRPKLAALDDEDTAKSFASDTVRIFNLLWCNRDSVRIVSDPLSLIPYYMAQAKNGTLVCSSIRHVFAALPNLSREIDDQAIFEFFCCGTAFGTRTLHKHVQLAKAGQVIQWDRSKGLKIDRSGRVTVRPADAGLAAPVAADQAAAYIRDSFGKLPSPGLLPLTGGFDSRLLACFAVSLRMNPRMVTLGYPKHDEIRVAQAVAKILGTKTTVFPPPHPDVLDLLPFWLECLEGLADAHTLFMANLLSFPESEGTPLYHGFIGDTMSGALLNRVALDTAREPEQIAAAVAAYFFSGISAEAGEALGLSASVRGGVEDIVKGLEPNLAPHQAFMLWNLENIQRRLVGHQLLYIGQRFMPAPVFYYRPLMEFWLSVPRMALDNRTLLLDIFQRHFPRVATLAHSERVPNMIPHTVPAMKYVSGWMARRYGISLLRRLKFDVEKMEAGSYIWSLWHGTTPQQRKKELEGLEETFGLLQSQLGWNAPRPIDTLWPECTTVTRKQLLMLRRMYLLAEYAKSLPQGAPVEPSHASYGASSHQ
jgi:hypothetical protein